MPADSATEADELLWLIADKLNLLDAFSRPCGPSLCAGRPEDGESSHAAHDVRALVAQSAGRARQVHRGRQRAANARRATDGRAVGHASGL